MLERFLIVWLSLLSLLAFVWPDIAPEVRDPFLASRPYLSPMIATIMFAVGCLLPRDEIRQVARRWPAVLGGTSVQYTAMPFLAWSGAQLFDLSAETRIGLMIVGCVPGAMASNVLTLVARGNVSYSVSLTACATMLSPVIVPLTLSLVLHATAQIDPIEVSLKLLREVVVPVAAGYLLCHRSERFRSVARTSAPYVANLMILWIIAVVVSVNRANLLQARISLLAALFTVNLLGYLAGYGGGLLLRLPEAMRRALTIEIGMQNAGLGTVLALTLFPAQPEAAIPPAVYTFGCMFTGTLLAQFFRRQRSGGDT